MIVVIFGLPGSGKGTQSIFLKEKYKLQLISVGDLLRGIISSNSDLGERIKCIVESGNLIEDDIICELLNNQLKLSDGNLLLDGFPRNLNQAHFLTQALMKRYNKDVDYVIELQASDSVVIDRLQKRLICLDCNSNSSLEDNSEFVCTNCKSRRLKRRVDDMDISIIQNRIRDYKLQMRNLRKYYTSKLLAIDAALSIDRVKEEINAKISVI